MERKRKLTPEEKAKKKKRKEQFTTVFVGGKQNRVKRVPMIEGLGEVEFLKRNGGPISLHQEGLWHLIDEEETQTDGDDAHEELFGPRK